MEKSTAHQLIGFMRLAENLKQIVRYQGMHGFSVYPDKPKRYESAADHSWRMALTLVSVVPFLSVDIDLEKALKIALIHDLPEIDAGHEPNHGHDGTGKDSKMTNPAVKQDKFTREDAAAKKIFATLPGDLGDELYALWLECEKNESPEARTVNAIKRIDGKLQALDYTHGVMYPDHYAFSISTGIEYTDADPLLREMMDIIITEMKERYVEFTLEDT